MPRKFIALALASLPLCLALLSAPVLAAPNAAAPVVAASATPAVGLSAPPTNPSKVSTPPVAPASPASAEPTPPASILALQPRRVVRGSPVTVSGEHFGTDPSSVVLSLGELQIGHPISVSDKSLMFVVPDFVGSARTPLGWHQLKARFGAGPTMAAPPYPDGFLEIVADSHAPLTLSAVTPRNLGPGMKQLTLLGDGFPSVAEDLHVLVDGQEVPLCWSPSCGDELHLAPTTGAHQRVLLGNLQGWLGQHTLSLLVGDEPASAETPFSVTDYTSDQIRNRALLLSGLVLALMIALALAGGSHLVGTTRYLVRAFLIDTETDSYSLSKLQFFAWSVTVLCGYAYLALARFLAQGSFTIPEVPDGMPGIIAISAGTAVTSIGITAARGPKAAGSTQPSFADLISVGGVVSPERFQFLLWTFVAIVAFLFTALRMDPMSMETLPAIPQSLLLLSGVSSAGYLGGRLVRSPGPVVDNVLVTGGSLILTIMGRNLSGLASIEINGKDTMQLMKPSPDDPTTFRPSIVEWEASDAARTKQLAKSLMVTLTGPDASWKSPSKATDSAQTSVPKLMLSVVNPDGQRADFDLVVPLEIWQKFVAEPTPSPGGSTPAPAVPARQPSPDPAPHGMAGDVF